MRLINTSTLTLEEFVGPSYLFPKYAILSHTWGDEEVSFQQFQTLQRDSEAGFQKIKRFCALAASRKIQYGWVDTCCIDKSSSAELSEAINSMYRWYQASECCYVYLSDMRRCSNKGHGFVEEGGVDPNFTAFKNCRWFQRGWCLQELLAPYTIYFFDQDWSEIGDKVSMLKLISQASGIQIRHLQFPQEASVAQKMSWTARRHTTRIEDMAYCLLGVFNVNMPLLYREGSKAFTRLQHQILASSDDESIFAWTNDTKWISGMLADWPHHFAGSGDIVSVDHPDLRRSPYFMSNHGLQIELAALKCDAQTAGRFETPLRCARQRSGKDALITIHLTSLGGTDSVKRVVRTGPSSCGTTRMTELHRPLALMPCYVEDFTCDRKPNSSDSDIRWHDPHSDLQFGMDPRLTRIRKGDKSPLGPLGGANVGFFIVGNQKHLKISSQTHKNALFYICWPQHKANPAFLNIHSRNHDTDKNRQWETPADAESLRSKLMKLHLGNSLITWLKGPYFLFIALGVTTSAAKNQDRSFIDMEVKSLSDGGHALKQMRSCDPLRTNANYPTQDENSGLDLDTLEEMPLYAGGDMLYGVKVRWNTWAD